MNVNDLKISKRKKNIRTTKFTKLVRNFKGFLKKRKKIILKKRNENDLNESEYFKILKEMMILGLTKNDIIDYFKKDRSLRAEIETRTVADFLTLDKDNIFLKNIRNISIGKLYSLIHCLNIEYYKKDDFIFQYKEHLNKFYIIFEGTVSLFLPYFVKKYMSVKEFLNYFFYTKKNFPKSFIRVEKKNEYLFDGIYQLKLNEYDINCISETEEKKQQDFYIEEYQNVYNINKGNQVNQISLLYNLVQNFNGFAQTDIYLLSLNKNDFMNILRSCLEEELSKEFGQLRKFSYIFNSWNNYSLAQIINYYIPFNFINEEILYNQRDESDSFYIIQEGSFDVYCEISLSEFSQYKQYVYQNNKNVMEWIKEQKEKKNKISVEKIIDYIQWKIKNDEYKEEKETIDKNNIYIQKKLLNKNEENADDLINLKVNEEVLKDKSKKIKIYLFTLNKNDYIGLEDSLELKSRFYSVQCSSERAIVSKIRILDFIVFVASNHGLELQNIHDYIKERKNKIIERIHIILKRHLNNSKRTITNAYSIALTSYEKRKKLSAKLKNENTFNFNYTSNLDKNKNENIFQKIIQLKQKNKNINFFQQYTDINSKRKKSAGIHRIYLFNNFVNNETKSKPNIQHLNWNFNEENKKSNTKDKRKKNKTNISSYILTTSNSEARSKISKNKRNKNISKINANINNIYHLKNNNFSNININLKKKIPHYNLTTTTLYYNNYDFTKNLDSINNSKYVKHILNMTGIYNTKREISKTKIVRSPPKDNKKPKRIFSGYKLSNNFIVNKKKREQNRPSLSLLSITNVKGIKLKKNKNKSIPNLKISKNSKIIK